MNIRNLRVLALSALVGTAPFASHAGGNLVVNGSFDDTNGTWVDNTGRAGDDMQSQGGTMVPGWTAFNNMANDLWIKTPNSYGGLTNSPGNASPYFIDLTGESNASPYGGLQQTIATQAGAAYTLTFDLGASTLYDGSGTNAAAVNAVVASGGNGLASGVFVLAPVTSNDWAKETLTFTANSAATTIQLIGNVGNSAYASRYVGIDNVSVTAAVPEPASVAMMVSGLCAVAWVARRRKG